MASSEEYRAYIAEQLSELDDIFFRPMMGEYIIYYQGRIVGGIYDNRFLVKPVLAARAMMPTAPYELPYEGAAKMLMVNELDDKAFLKELLDAMYPELPAPKKKK